MGNTGVLPNYGQIHAPDSFTGDGATTQFTLSHAVSSDQSVIWIEGALPQKAGTDYTVSSTTLTRTTAPANGVECFAVYLGVTLDINTPADSTVTNAKVASNAEIDRTKLADPGAWVLIGTNEASASSALTQTGLDSTYDTYAICLSDMVPASDGETLRMTVGDSGGLDTGASDYSYHNTRSTHAANTYAAVNNATLANVVLSSSCGSAAGEGYGGIVYIHRPGDGTTQPTFSWKGMSIDDTGAGIEGSGTAKRNAVITLDRVSVFFNSGNITSGRMTVYGIAHT